jgi:penicillin-binding protein 1A
MTPQSEESAWNQHFPTYQFKERDIALEEYKFATKTLEAEERVFLNAANLSVVVGAALGSLALGNLEKLVAAFAPIVPSAATLTLVLLLAYGFGVLSLRYFADRQKAVVFAARKVIVLRRMLGMSYGSLQLVLPNWRIEGADEPFSVRLFPGWHTYVAYPCYAIAGISAAVAFFVLAVLLKHVQPYGAQHLFIDLPLLVGVAAAWFVALSWVYRVALLDTHERPALIVARRLADAIGIRLVGNFEYVIYRATLAKHELHRLGVGLSTMKRVLVHVEDKEFYSHTGISLRGIGRLLLYVVGRRRRSGGSTITQQLVRTLFIVDQSKVIRRKLVEILLARWFNRVFAKTDQLEMYLASVRFEAGVFGLSAAMRHFFGAVKKSTSPAEAFFLIERVSNIRSRVLVEKVDQTLRSAVAAGILTEVDARQVVELYDCAVGAEKAKDPEGSAIARLVKAWKRPNEAPEPTAQSAAAQR